LVLYLFTTPNVKITGPVIAGKQLRTEPINTLVTGVPYGHVVVPNTEHTLRSAPTGNGSMIIDVVRSNPQTVVDGGGNSHTVYNYALAIRQTDENIVPVFQIYA
jgi:hypothetical protein